MPVPDFQSMMLPFLKFAEDGKEYEASEVTEHIAQHFNLSDEDRQELLPSGNTTRLLNRVGWCRTHLKHAELIEYVRRGVFRITERGRELVATNPAKLNLKSLDQFPEHYAWFHPDKTKEDSTEEEANGKTPEEQIAELMGDLKKTLAADLLDRVKAMNPFKFERLVLDLLLAMGYGGSREEAATVTQKSNDEGVDGLINEDRLGLDRIYVQAKRWQNTVSRPEIQSFVGALAGKNAQKGIFITTSNFSQSAIDYAASVPNQRVILMDGKRLTELMIEHNVAVSRAYAYEIKRIDSDYFEEG